MKCLESDRQTETSSAAVRVFSGRWIHIVHSLLFANCLLNGRGSLFGNLNLRLERSGVPGFAVFRRRSAMVLRLSDGSCHTARPEWRLSISSDYQVVAIGAVETQDVQDDDSFG
jgi:hypothetical protein